MVSVRSPQTGGQRRDNEDPGFGEAGCVCHVDSVLQDHSSTTMSCIKDLKSGWVKKDVEWKLCRLWLFLTSDIELQAASIFPTCTVSSMRYAHCQPHHIGTSVSGERH